MWESLDMDSLPPHANTLAEDFFFSSALVINSWKSLEAWISCPFFLLPSPKCHQMCKMPPSQRRRIFFPPTTPLLSPFCHINLNIFGSIFFSFLAVYVLPISFFYWLHQLIKNNKKKNPQRTLLHPPSVMFSSLAEIKMSQRVSEKGCRRKTSVSGRPTPLFLLSHGSSVPSGLHTTTETPYQQCAQEGDNFSVTSGKGGTILKTKSKLLVSTDEMTSLRLKIHLWRLTGHLIWIVLEAVFDSQKNITNWPHN